MDPDPDKEIELDPDLDPERGFKGIQIRPNEVDPGGSGSETLISNVLQYISNLYMKKGGLSCLLPMKGRLHNCPRWQNQESQKSHHRVE